MHSLALTLKDVNDLIATLQKDSDTITLESSSSNDPMAGSGIEGGMHSHVITLSKAQLTQLRDTGNLSIESETALDHKHTFQFMTTQSCPAVLVPVATPSPSSSPSASPSPSESPSPTGSPSTSPTPSPTPTSTSTPGM